MCCDGGGSGRAARALPRFAPTQPSFSASLTQATRCHSMFSHAGGSQFFRYFDENFYSGLLTVAYELEDTVCNDGGFGPTPCPSV